MMTADLPRRSGDAPTTTARGGSPEPHDEENERPVGFGEETWVAPAVGQGHVDVVSLCEMPLSIGHPSPVRILRALARPSRNPVLTQAEPPNTYKLHPATEVMQLAKTERV
ncbi:hypothetical protein GGTG_01829 [Gaeumannomyces tritici R3-111a-1]|uniref:Uncharacterized protein n=1 Tax=Gaeumannomyces tritici (strain R3-111a-1) TaxID=644352 RepID=J3NKN8_GAET3|nr:hypothetical protein GGTG_01829 [Gaeumannomyces tritici R3-111a-1]EJT81855.1 hypothetical protein GGTG_01829 [Gaeumannomyces tritici R3-111a-1]